MRSFRYKGKQLLEPRYIGDNMVLLSDVDGKDLAEVFRNEEQWLHSIFEALQPWQPSDVSGNRVVWIRCTGVPLYAWQESFFQSVVSHVGSFVTLDDNTTMFNKLEYACIFICTSSFEAVANHKRMMINDRIYDIRMVEETWRDDITKCCYNSSISSD